MISLSGKIALVTGASRGLGRAIALALGKAGADVVVTDLLVEGLDANQNQLAAYSVLAAHFSGTEAVKTMATSQEIEKFGVRSAGFQMDITDLQQIADVMGRVKEQFGTVDILVNNAGVMDNMALLEKQSAELWERDLRVNLSGAFHVTKAVWPEMKEKR